MKNRIVFFFCLFFTLFANAAKVEVDGIYYKLFPNDGIAEVVAHPNNAYADSIVIPEMISYEGTDYQVTSIGEGAFFCCDKVLSASLPNSIQFIGKNAFWGCHSLDSIAIPELVTTIEPGVFADCPSLRRVILPEEITSIGNSSFNCCYSLDSLILPHALETIEDWVFTDCKKLSRVVIPQSLKHVGKGAFAGCSSLMSVEISDLSSWCNISFSDMSANPLCISKILVLNGEEITDLVIPEDVSFIGNYAFYPCSNLTSLTIGSQVSDIGQGAFGNCSNITSVTCYPRKVPQTGRNVFNNDAVENATLYVVGSAVSAYQETDPWRNFKEIVGLDIPKHQLSYYVDDELYRSYTLEEGEEIIPEPAPKKDGYTFSGWSEIPKTMPAYDVTVTGFFTLTSQHLISDGLHYTLWEKDKTADVSGMVPDSNETFSGHLIIPSVVSKDGTEYIVTCIADSAFMGCDSIVSVIVPESVEFIGKDAFSGCKLQNVFAKNSVVQLESNSFSQAAYNHAMLYIPTGQWSEAIYNGSLWRFINIRETATGMEELSSMQAYTMMDANTFGYVVYDAVNDEVRPANAYFNVDENIPNNSWQLAIQDGMNYLYNIGAKKYAVLNADGKIHLSVTPVPLNMENGNDGIIIGGDKQMQWNFVLNDKICVDQNILGVETITHTSDAADYYYLPNGMNVSNPFKGFVIIKSKDGSVKKIIK